MKTLIVEENNNMIKCDRSVRMGQDPKWILIFCRGGLITIQFFGSGSPPPAVFTRAECLEEDGDPNDKIVNLVYRFFVTSPLEDLDEQIYDIVVDNLHRVI